MLRVHGIRAANEMPPRIVCSECKESFETLGHAREHIATEHIIEKESIVCSVTLFSHPIKLTKRICNRSMDCQRASLKEQ